LSYVRSYDRLMSGGTVSQYLQQLYGPMNVN
jgi:hypothetical protein